MSFLSLGLRPFCAALACGFPLSVATTGETPAAVAAVSPVYTLVWSDEFNTDGPPSPANWTMESGFVRNHEAQFYQSDNATVKNGVLIIEARREAVPNPLYEPGSNDWKRKEAVSTYTSASMHTRGLHQWLYGRFEMRARIDTQAGLWPAWWTLGTEHEWPQSGEIDMMEYYGGNLLANFAWGTRQQWKAKWQSSKTPLAVLGGPEWAKEFHVWRMDWSSDAIRLYVDERLLNEIRVADAHNPDGFLPFRQPHVMLLSLALGGQKGGSLDGTKFPVKFEIDWVRVFQPKP